MSWKPAGADTQLTVGLTQFSNSGLYGCFGDVFVNLRVHDPGAPWGEVAAETDLTSADARMLAAALVCAAERLDLLAAARMLRGERR